MNTQRPEWNDANNALVGKGLSVVTLGYLRRYVVFFHSFLERLMIPIWPLAGKSNSLLDNIISHVLSQKFHRT